MNFSQILEQIDRQFALLIGLALILSVLLLLWLYRYRMQRILSEWRTERCLRSIGTDQIRHLVCPDGLDGYFTIDRLALTPNTIVLINHKRYAGRIYCAEQIAEWTQVVGQKSFKFENPLFELENQLTAIKLLTGSQGFTGYLFFDPGASFPKGHPDSVLIQEAIPESLLNPQGEKATVQPAIQSVWNQLLAIKQEVADEQRITAKP